MYSGKASSFRYAFVTSGKCAALLGGGVLLGEDEQPFPNMFVTMIKYLLGSKPLPGPMSQSLSVWLPEYQVGYTMALFLSLFRLPQVLHQVEMLAADLLLQETLDIL